MSFQDITRFIIPIGLIVTGILIKCSKNKEMFGTFKKYWFILVLIGILLFLLRLFKNLK
jgi:hypothetical protein